MAGDKLGWVWVVWIIGCMYLIGAGLDVRGWPRVLELAKLGAGVVWMAVFYLVLRR